MWLKLSNYLNKLPCLKKNVDLKLNKLLLLDKLRKITAVTNFWGSAWEKWPQTEYSLKLLKLTF